MAVCLDYQSVYCARRDKMGAWSLTLAAAVLLLLALVFKVWISVRTTDMGYRLAEQQQRAIEIDMERREYELQLSVLMRPDTLARMAEQRLGLRQLDPQQARTLE